MRCADTRLLHIFKLQLELACDLEQKIHDVDETLRVIGVQWWKGYEKLRRRRAVKDALYAQGRR